MRITKKQVITGNTNQWNRNVIVDFNCPVDSVGALHFEFLFGLAQQFIGDRAIVLLVQPITKGTPQRAGPLRFRADLIPLKTKLLLRFPGFQKYCRQTFGS